MGKFLLNFLWIAVFFFFEATFVKSFGNVDLKASEIDAEILDILWCGSSQDQVLVLTASNSVYRSQNHGFTWIKLNDILQHTGSKELEPEDNEIGKVSRIIMSPIDKNLIVFIGTHGINWISSNCGSSVKALNHGRSMNEFVFHPTERSWGLASAFSICSDYVKEPCKINKELFVTKDLGENWEEIGSYIVQFSWGVFDESSIKNGIPKERILIAHEPKGKGHQKFDKLSYKIDFAYSDDFFKSSTVGVHKGNKFLLTKSYLYVAQLEDQESQEIQLVVSNSTVAKYDFKPVTVGTSGLKQHSFSFLDTSENSVFLHINHFGENSKFGNIYASSFDGTTFFDSLKGNIIVDGVCDFEKAGGVEGIYIANIMDPKYVKDNIQEIKKKKKKKKKKN